MSDSLTFSKRIVARNDQVYERAPEYTGLMAELSEKSYPVGTIGSDVRDMMRMVEEGRREEIPVPKEFGTLKTVVRSYWLELPDQKMDFNGDGIADKLLLRTALIPEGDQRSITTTWLIAVIDRDGDGQISADEEKTGVVIASGMMAGNTAPIIDIKVRDFDGNGTSDVGFVKYDRTNGQYDRYEYLSRNDGKEIYDIEDDRDLILSAMRYYDTVVQAPETAYVKLFINQKFMPEVEMVEPSKAVAIPDVLRPLYGSMKEIDSRFDRLTLVPAHDQLGSQLRMLNKLFVREANLSLVLSSEDLIYRAKALGDLTKEFQKLEKTLEWKGEKMSHTKYEELLRQEMDEKTRRKMALNYERHYAPMYKKGGKFHQFVEKMNEIARKYGYNNYAEMRIQEKFGVSMADFKEWVADTMAATEADARAYVEDLKTFSGKKRLDYWDVDPISKEWALKEAGLEKMPEIPAKDALRILKQFYKDMGYDLDQIPYKNITMDPFAHPMKYDAAGVAATATPSHAYFTSNIDPEKKIPLNSFETMLHEMLHDIHYMTSGQVGGGYSSYQNGMYAYVAESITMTTQDLPFGTPELMKKYFGKLPGFNDKFCEVYPAMKRKQNAFMIRRLLTMAMGEINLYESDKRWNKRVRWFEDVCEDKLFVKPKTLKMGQIQFRSHSYGEQSQMGYASYPLGFATVKRIREAIIKEGTPEELKAYGDAVRKIMEGGALTDQKQMLEIVREAEEK